MKTSFKLFFLITRDITKDNNTTKTECGFLGNFFLNNVGLLTLLLETKKIVIKNSQLDSHQSNVLFIFIEILSKCISN